MQIRIRKFIKKNIKFWKGLITLTGRTTETVVFESEW